jgi:hypothetical protein
MAVADLHFSVGSGECRDTDKTPCIGDAETLKWLGEALDAENPDLVVRPPIPSDELTPGILGRPAERSKDFI